MKLQIVIGWMLCFISGYFWYNTGVKHGFYSAKKDVISSIHLPYLNEKSKKRVHESFDFSSQPGRYLVCWIDNRVEYCSRVLYTGKNIEF